MCEESCIKKYLCRWVKGFYSIDIEFRTLPKGNQCIVSTERNATKFTSDGYTTDLPFIGSRPTYTVNKVKL